MTNRFVAAEGIDLNSGFSSEQKKRMIDILEQWATQLAEAPLAMQVMLVSNLCGLFINKTGMKIDDLIESIEICLENN